MTKSLHATCGVLFAITYAAASSAQPQDIELIPPANGGVSVKGGNTNEQLFRINEAGEVFIKNLPSELSGAPLCWNETTGRLGKCAPGGSGGTGGDITPPTIEANVPEIAESSLITFTLRYSDDTELAYRGNDGTITQFFAAGVKSLDTEQTIEVDLGDVQNRLLIAADMSGNVTKMPVQILSPETGFKFGDYDLVTGGTLPDGFSCASLFGDLDGSLVNIATLGSSSDWSVASGYKVFVSLQVETALFPTSIGSASEDRILLEATSASLRSMSQTGSEGTFFYIGNMEVSAADPSVVDLTIQMECDVEGVTTIGEEARLTIRAQ